MGGVRFRILSSMPKVGQFLKTAPWWALCMMVVEGGEGWKGHAWK